MERRGRSNQRRAAGAPTVQHTADTQESLCVCSGGTLSHTGESMGLSLLATESICVWYRHKRTSTHVLSTHPSPSSLSHRLNFPSCISVSAVHEERVCASIHFGLAVNISVVPVALPSTAYADKCYWETLHQLYTLCWRWESTLSCFTTCVPCSV